MRIKNDKQDISYQNTKDFFDRRAQKYKEDNPYSVTMYQDAHPDLVTARNQKEIEKLKPMLMLDEDSKILDVACGIGRWSDAVTEPIKEYCGIDFCEDFIKLARQRNEGASDRFFYQTESRDFLTCLEENQRGSYNRILMIGVLMYLNDSDLSNTLEQVVRICEEHSIICIREPIGIEERLTLKEQFSEELDDMYNAIYRTRDELYEYIEKAFIAKGFQIQKEGFLFEDNLNNRKETSQYYFILKR